MITRRARGPPPLPAPRERVREKGGDHMSHTVSLEAWQEFLTTHAEGGVLDGRVTQVKPFGAVVDLGNGVVGLLRGSTDLAPEAPVSVRIDAVDLERRRVSLLVA